MASSVYWKFKSQKDESRVTFDGPTISVSDLKREIILQNNLVSSASDFDLLIVDPSTEQEFKDDNHQIARSTSVLAKRLPAARPGKGKAAQYVMGINPNDISRPDSTSAGANRPTPRPQELPQIVVPEGTSADEAAGIAAMFQASQEIWDETQEKMAQATPVYTNRGGFRGGKPFNQGTRGQDGARQESRPVPPGYICYRCAKKGHWIHDCPTNDDRDWDNRPRVKRTTGIPRSFLKTVEQTTDGPLGQGVMVTPDGGFVVAQPDSVAWQKQRARPKVLTTSEIYQNPAPATYSSLACPICDRLTKSAVRTPCCKQTFCEECIQTYLLEHDFVCKCGKKIASFDRLEVDDKRREKVGEAVRTMIEESRKESVKQEAEESQPTPIATASSTPTPAPEKPSTPTTTTNTGPDLADLQAQMAQLSQMLSNPGLPQQAKQQAQRQAAKIRAEIQKLMNAGAAAGAIAGAGDGAMQMAMGMNGGMGMNGPGMGGMGMNGMGMGGPMGGMGMNGMGMNGMGMPGNMNMGMGMGGMGMNGMNPGMNGMNMGGMGPGPGMRGGMGMPNMGMNHMGMGMGGMGMNNMGMGMGMGGPMGMNMNMGMMSGPGNPMMNPHHGQNWTNPYANQQPLGNESAYQRLPVHNRRKKRDRPSDFVEVGGEQAKVPRYWE